MEKNINVYMDMSADIIHYGHVRIFKQARELGNRLIVGIHSDETVESYKRIPIMTMEERIEVIEAFRDVDVVIPNAPLVITEEYISEHNIDIVCHGHSDEEHDDYRYMYEIPEKMGIFRRLNYTYGISTTMIIERLKQNYNL